MFFPFFSLAVYLIVWGLMSIGILPDISTLFTISNTLDSSILLYLMGLVIFLESIIYVGFYLPGQFIAVILVISASDSLWDVIPLTLVSVVAVTCSAGVNYMIGSFFRKENQEITPVDWKRILLSLIHINTLALAIFEAGKLKYPKWIIALVGIINLPYYLLMIVLVYQFQDPMRALGENPYYLLITLIIWCGYSVWKSRK